MGGLSAAEECGQRRKRTSRSLVDGIGNSVESHFGKSSIVTRLRILTVSDSEPFGTLVRRLVAAGSFDFEVSVSRQLSDEQLRDPTLALVIDYAEAAAPMQEHVQLITRCCRSHPPVPVVMVSEDCAPGKMIAWLRAGAADCLSDPVDRDRLQFLFDSLTVTKRAAQRGDARSGCWVTEGGTEPICCASPYTAALLSQIRQLAPQQTNVMLVGETGTGKTRWARLLHEISPRRNDPFVAVNCAAMPTTLLESELFGHRRGAFTGADSHHDGKFSHVKGGTLLLDEVDTLPLEAQAKLLRTVDDRVFEPLGSNKSEEFTGRLVVATNQNLPELVEAGQFRADLYYRLNVVELYVAPLRERQAEILEIARACIVRHARSRGIEPPCLSPEVKCLLESYGWPGNVRELQNVMARAMTFSQGSMIHLTDLPGYLLGTEEASQDLVFTTRYDAGHSVATDTDRSAVTLASARAEGEKRRLIEVLRKHNDNRSQAAKELGISRTALYKRLNKYGLVGFSAS